MSCRQCLCFSPPPSGGFVICWFGELNADPKFQRFPPLYDSDMTYIFYLIWRVSKSSNCRLFTVQCPAVTFPPEAAPLLVATRQSESKNGSGLLPVGFIPVPFSEKVCFCFIMLPCMPEESLSYIVDCIWDRNWEMSNPNQNILFHSLAIDIQKTELLPEPKVFHCHCPEIWTAESHLIMEHCFQLWQEDEKDIICTFS